MAKRAQLPALARDTRSRAKAVTVLARAIGEDRHQRLGRQSTSHQRRVIAKVAPRHEAGRSFARSRLTHRKSGGNGVPRVVVRAKARREGDGSGDGGGWDGGGWHERHLSTRRK